MKQLLVIITSLFATIYGIAQPSYEEWDRESQTNKRLLPRYGHLPKSDAEIQADSSFIRETMSMPQFKSRREASNHLIGLGFRYYYRPDFKTAMYRFNQAYLLDSTNTDIFWGYGAIYMGMGQFDLAKIQYETGLSIYPNNTHLMTDLGTYFMQQHAAMDIMPANDIVKNPKQEARKMMDSALFWLNKSYALDPKDANTTYKLSICYYDIKDCANAWKYYDACKSLEGASITEEYTRDLEKLCKKN